MPHTPKPYTVDTCGWPLIINSEQDGPFSIVALVPEVSPQDEPQALANAKLFAAAPDLLEACIDALNITACNCSYTPAEGPRCSGTCTHGLLKTAVAKATTL